MGRIFKSPWFRWLAAELSSGRPNPPDAPHPDRPVVAGIRHLGATRWRSDLWAMGTVRGAPNPPHHKARTDRPG